MNITPTIQTQYTQPINNTTAIKATSAYESVAPAQQSDRLALMTEKYKDVYTPIPMTYSPNDEEVQLQKIYEAYPDYVPFDTVIKRIEVVRLELGGRPFEFGIHPTREDLDLNLKAYEIVMEQLGGKEYHQQMLKDVEQIKNDYPINNYIKRGLSNAKELTRFENAVVYEGLEQGKTLVQAKLHVASLMSNYLDPDHFKDVFIKANEMVNGVILDPNFKSQPQPVRYGSNSSTLDLREYGIEGNWEDNDIYKSNEAMVAEMEKKLKQFYFMLSNPDIIAKKKSTKDADHRGSVENTQKALLNEYIPRTKLIMSVFKNYQIYDSVNVKA